ncbi:P-loop containing nucleoside triphosphate hydrolase protein [Mycena amicta]|nr:P-loop containing nucleoside triphosphate hydrolase protein [Mycena amicta]
MAGKRKATTNTAKQKTLFDHFKPAPAHNEPVVQPVIDIEDEKPPVPPPTPVIDLTLESPTPARHVRMEAAPPKPTYPIFNPRPSKTPNSVAPAASGSKLPGVPLPFPTKESQHVRGLQTAFTTISFPLRSAPGAVRALTEEPGSLKYRPDTVHGLESLPRKTSSLEERDKCIESILDEHKQSHPAIAGLSAATANVSSSAEQLWSDRWRPRRADNVLGNEENAVYLRDWLSALEVRLDISQEDNPRGLKRPRVKRSVSRARKRQRQSSDEFEWIVSDASDYSEAEILDGGRDDDDFELADGTLPELGPFDQHLANTIILFGPPGSGKTAAVYACAEELDWEVFEVYPGVGKRNGASVEALIGELGKNHLVRRTQTAGRKKGDEGSDFGFITPKQEAGARQSLILLEEVDVLFREDANFWPAVIRLIKDCKRPVICTCNDISLVPVDDLPLQTTLRFESCPSDVAASYLQALCCTAGYVVDRDALLGLYGDTMDLRRAIQHLQLGLALEIKPESDDLPDWNSATRKDVPYADTISFLDAYMTRNGKPRVFATSEWLPSGDDEIGYPIVADAEEDEYAQYDWDTTIVEAVTAVSRIPRIGRARVDSDYARLIDKMKEHRALAVGVMERREAHTDYLPWLQQIVVAEDVLVAASLQQGRRGTRNSRRYERNVELEDQVRQLLYAVTL